MRPIQIALLVLIALALGKVVRRFRQGRVRLFDFIFWTAVWGVGALFVVWPNITTVLATSVGIGRGVDLVTYVSFIALFYLVFRLYVRMEYFQRDITELTRHLALREMTGARPADADERRESPRP